MIWSESAEIEFDAQFQLPKHYRAYWSLRRWCEVMSNLRWTMNAPWPENMTGPDKDHHVEIEDVERVYLAGEHLKRASEKNGD